MVEPDPALDTPGSGNRSGNSDATGDVLRFDVRDLDGPALTTAKAPEPRGPYPHVRFDGQFLWVTGQIGRDPGSGQLVGGGFGPEFHQAITNLEQILIEAGSGLDQVVRTCVQFVAERDLDAMNQIYGERFPAPYPARSSFGVAFLWKGAQVQIDAVARRR